MRIASLFLMLLVLLCSSCATIINSKMTRSKVLVNEPARVVVEGDTSAPATEHLLPLKRSSKPVEIHVLGDSVTRSIAVKPIPSPALLLNLAFWPLILVDGVTERGDSYPRRIYVDLNSDKPGYLTYKVPEAHQNNILKITPLRVVGLVNPSIEIIYERRTGNQFATQLMISPLLPGNIFDARKQFNTEIKGFRTAIEERWYFKKSAPARKYFALEIDYLKNRYRAWNWFFDGPPDPDLDPDFGLQYLDTFNVKKFTAGFALKFGIQKLVNRFVIDYYVGLGAKYREATHYNRRNPDDIMVGPRHPNVWHETNRDGKFWTILFPMNIRVGWLF